MKNKIPAPAILSAHDLREGYVAYWTGELWSRDINQAKIAHADDEIIEMETVAASFIAQNIIVDFAIIPIAHIAYKITSKTLRESFLISGPTIDYGEPSIEGALNVSI
ncbi:MAG: hypothetical protein FD163_2193 [Hyphomonadaceae bacterium]|nr:MAG: hypothetical protein FD128_1034 [Hyphomonadaceae bacterium]KAF0183473.1 MAG: hypothetical protein FD163_2193 [Hyphomonadaceae bacterium]